MLKERLLQLDALRGYAIFTMILSGSIAYGPALPGWMFHAQVPPPTHQVNPLLPGITWVDLVFPFFLFCMGAAIPIALQKASTENKNLPVVLTAFRRYMLLAGFAIFLEHMKAARITSNPTNTTYLFSIGGFLILFLAFAKLKKFVTEKTNTIINWVFIVISVFILAFVPLNNGEGFLLNKSDIIILVLANMALFGTLAWWFTRNNPLLRIGLLPFIAAVFMGAKEIGSWNEWLYNLTPSAAIYKFYFLKYLFIIIPGTFAGEWFLKEKDFNITAIKTSKQFGFIALLSLLLIVVNLYGLYTRNLLPNVFVTIGLLVALSRLIITKQLPHQQLIKLFFNAGAYCLLLGLTLEACEGGIKKDVSTYSYYFVTSGLAFFAFFTMAILSTIPVGKNIHNFFVLVGRNPMMAYVTGGLLILPILHITGLYPLWNSMNTNTFQAFMKGFLYTVIVCAFTIPFTKRGMIWKS
jgi:predicted acyltransferase